MLSIKVCYHSWLWNELLIIFLEEAAEEWRKKPSNSWSCRTCLAFVQPDPGEGLTVSKQRG